jgi:hypothetical protein
MKRFNMHGKVLVGVLAITLGAGLAQGIPKPQDAYAAMEHSEYAGIREASASDAEKEEEIEEISEIPLASHSDAEYVVDCGIFVTKPEKKPRLPKEVEIREGEKEAVVWELSSEQYEEEGRFLAEGYSEDDRIKAEAQVIVSESEPEAETVYLTAESGESPELPEAVLVTIGNVIEEFPA